MKTYIFPLALILSLPASVAAQGIDSVLSAIETNNIQLKAMRAEINAATHELKAENSLDGPSIESHRVLFKGMPLPGLPLCVQFHKLTGNLLYRPFHPGFRLFPFR